MVIKKSSRIFRYLSWLDKVYESKLIESKSLCPLFWKTILMTLFFPIFLPFIGLINLAKIVIDKYISKMVVPNYIKIGLEMILFCSITAFLCTVVGVIVYHLITDFLHTCLVIGIGSLFILVCASPTIAAIAVRKYFERKAKEEKVHKVKDTSVKDFVIEGISSIKNKVCPLIVFEEEEIKLYPSKDYLKDVTLESKTGAVAWMMKHSNNKRKTDKQLLEDGEENI